MLELLSLRKGMTMSKEMFLNHLYGGIGRAGTENNRRVHVQAAQEARQRLGRQGLHRNGVGSRLYVAATHG